MPNCALITGFRVGQVPRVVGQVVLEGVIMRGPGSFAVAVRRPTGEIVVCERNWRTEAEIHAFWRLPVLRGFMALLEGLRAHLCGLAFAAEQWGLHGPLACAVVGRRDLPARRTVPLLGFFVALCWALVGFLGLGVLLPHALSAALGPLFRGSIWGSVALCGLSGGVKLAVLSAYLLYVRRLTGMRRLLMYHGAEHKAVAALEAGSTLEVAYVRRFGMIYARCGVSWTVWSILLASLSTSLLVTCLPASVASGQAYEVVLAVRALLWVPVIGVAYEVTHWTASHLHRPWVRALSAPALWLQRLTVCEPTDGMLEVALVALRAALSRSGRAPVDDGRQVRFGLHKLVGACARTGVRVCARAGARRPARVSEPLCNTGRTGLS